MNEREMRRLERQHESRRERACEDREVETTEAAAQSGWLTCACCEHRGPRGEVEPQLEDGEQGLYVTLCVDQEACLWRFRELMGRWHAARPGAPLVVYDDTFEMPF